MDTTPLPTACDGTTLISMILLSPSPIAAGDDDTLEVKTLGEAWDVFVTESKKLWKISIPIAFNILCLYDVNSTTQIFVGHIGHLELSAVAITLSVVSNFSFGFLLGMGSALETLCGQAFGAGQVEMLGVYMQRFWIILLASSLLMCPLYLFATPSLKLLGQEEAIAKATDRFTVSLKEMWIMMSDFSLAIIHCSLTNNFWHAKSTISLAKE